MGPDRLIDQIQFEVTEKNLWGEITHICMSEEGYDELLKDFEEEFTIEYLELGRSPSKNDLQDYLNFPIIIDESVNGEKFKLLAKA